MKNSIDEIKMEKRLLDVMPDRLLIPRYIRCYVMKRKATVDYITVVFTHAAEHSGRQYRGRVVYRGYNGNPFNPLGFAQWGEAESWRFHASGSRVSFMDLPKETQECVIRDYMGLWEIPDLNCEKYLVDAGNGWRINYGIFG